jgi:aryl-alcohol dehydrogenase-like predicted oxidoreductase
MVALTITRRDAIKAGMAAAAVLTAGPLGATRVAQPLFPPIGIGTARRYDVGTSEEERGPLRETLREFVKLGGTLVDTAPSYGNAESVVGDLVAELKIRDQIFLATKVGAGRNGAEAGLAEMKESLKRLRTDRFDLLQIHNLAGVAAMLPILRDWKKQGVIRYLGVSTSNAKQYAELAELMRNEQLDVIQVDYALDNRAAEETILPLARERGIDVITNLPFGRGRVFEKFKGREVPQWAQEWGIRTWAQFALKFVVSHPAVSAAIPGTAKVEYARDNFAAGKGPMPDAAARKKMVELVEG